MKDRALLNRSIRENIGICLMASALLLLSVVLMAIAYEGPLQLQLPDWLYALPTWFWKLTGLFFVCTALCALLLCALTVRHGYQHYLVEYYGVAHSAIVTGKEIEELRLPASRGQSPDDARLIRIGHVSYRYGMNGRTVEDRFILSAGEIELFHKIAVGDQIPLRILPYKPRRSMLHREKLEQQYRWREPVAPGSHPLAEPAL